MQLFGPRAFAQVDVFSATPGMGNALAVVLEADGMSEAMMSRVARWTNLSETVYVLAPTDPRAHYRVRIFTPNGELPFAGHPTLGTAAAWLQAGFGRGRASRLVQECGLGLVDVRIAGDVLSFAAPEPRRSGPASTKELKKAAAALGIDATEVVEARWSVNGPEWLVLQLRDVDAVLAVEPRFEAMGELELGVFALYPEGSELLYEARAFDQAMGEDPVTGSLHAGVAQWLAGAGLLTSQATAGQGQCVGREGRVLLTLDGDTVWVGGRCSTLIKGTIEL